MRVSSVSVFLVITTPLLAGANCTNLFQRPADPRQRDFHQAQCVRQLQESDVERATASCKVCLEYEPANPECNNAYGLIHYVQGDFAEARVRFKAAIRRNPDFADARNNFGVLLLNVDRNPDDAITMFESAIRINPAFQDARYNLGLAHMQQGDAELADAINRLSGHTVDSLQPSVRRQLFARAEARYAKADDQLTRLLEINVNHYRAAALIAYIELQRAQYAPDDARRQVHFARSERYGERCVLGAPPDVKEAHQCRGNLAAVFESQHRCEEAMDQYLSCLAVSKDVECTRGVERTSACLAITQGALQHAMKVLVDNPSDAQSHYAVCSAAITAQMPSLAARACENAVELDRSLCQARFLLAGIYRDRADAERAIESCKAYFECSPVDSPQARECADLVVTLQR